MYISEDTYNYLVAKSNILNKVYQDYFDISPDDEVLKDSLFGVYEKKYIGRALDFDIDFMDYLEDIGILNSDMSNIFDIKEDFNQFISYDDLMEFPAYKKLDAISRGAFQKVLSDRFGINNMKMLGYMVFRKRDVYECLFAVKG